jgi:hypothetical protein
MASRRRGTTTTASGGMNETARYTIDNNRDSNFLGVNTSQAFQVSTARNNSKTVLLRSHQKVPPLMLSKEQKASKPGDEYRMYTGASLDAPITISDTRKHVKTSSYRGTTNIVT